MPDAQLIELTPYGKRWQLWGNGVKGTEADAIIEQLYGPQS